MRLSLAVLAGAAAVADAFTPDGFFPETEEDIFVSYGNIRATNEREMDRLVTQEQPFIATASTLGEGTFAVMMIDMDIPTMNPPETGLLLHWMQTGLRSTTEPVSISADTGELLVFPLLNSTANLFPGPRAPAAPYIGPNPPARIPLAHRYVFLLVNTTDVTPQAVMGLETAATQRFGFNASDVLTEVGLIENVLGGAFFIVSNPGPVEMPPGMPGMPGMTMSMSAPFPTGTGSPTTPIGTGGAFLMPTPAGSADAVIPALGSSGPAVPMAMLGAAVLGGLALVL